AQQLAPDGPDALARNTLPEVTVEGDLVDEYKVDEVVSPKFVKPLLDTPQTIQVISSDLFQSQAATTLTEALRNSPGVGTFYVGENGTTTTGDAVYLRCFDSSGTIFVDGVRDLGSISRDVFNTEQIEVTKGPAGTDNGRTAPTGAINLVTKQPFAGDLGEAQVSWGSADQKRVTADFNRDIGEAGGAAFRLNVMGQESGVPGRDEVENNRWGIAPSIAFGLGTPTRGLLDYLHIRQDNVPDGGGPTIGLPGYTDPAPGRPGVGHAAGRAATRSRTAAGAPPRRSPPASAPRPACSSITCTSARTTCPTAACRRSACPAIRAPIRSVRRSASRRAWTARISTAPTPITIA